MKRIFKANEKEVPDWLWVSLITFFVSMPIMGYLGHANSQGTIIIGGRGMLLIWGAVYLVMFIPVVIGYAILKVVKGDGNGR